MTRRAITFTINIPVPQFGSAFESPWQLLSALWRVALNWQVRAVQRHHLAAMEERLRRDAGLSPEQIRREVQKPFWRA